MKESEQLELLERILKEKEFVAPEIKYKESEEEQLIRERFEQKVLRSSAYVLRHIGGKMGLLPKLINDVWENFTKKELAQVIIHAYRQGLRMSETMDVVYPAPKVEKQKEGKERKKEEMPKKKADDFWDDMDNMDDMGDMDTELEDFDNPKKEEEKSVKLEKIEDFDSFDSDDSDPKPEPKAKAKAAPAKKRSSKKTKTEESARPTKDGVEVKLDSVVKTLLSMQNQLEDLQKEATGQAALLDRWSEKLLHTEKTLINLDIKTENIVQLVIRSAYANSWLVSAVCSLTNKVAKDVHKKLKEKTEEALAQIEKDLRRT